MDCKPPGSSVHGILQARVLEWVAIPFLGDVLDPGIIPKSLALLVDSLPSEPPGMPQEHADLTIIKNVKRCNFNVIKHNSIGIYLSGYYPDMVPSSN